MKRIIIAVTLVLALTAFAAHAVEQIAFSGAGVIESTTGGFKFPDGSTQTSASEGGLDDLACEAGEIAKFDGANWVCAADNDTDLSTQVAELQALVATLQSQLAANTAADALAHHDKYTDAEAIAAVGPHSPDYSDLLSGVSRIIDPYTGYDTIRFSGMNVQIVYGGGGTDGTGNLIIGYNEPRPEEIAEAPCPSDVETEFWCNRRTGSHMLVVGQFNNYTSYGGIVGGFGNETAGEFSTVSGGYGNIASATYASVSGGIYATASGEHSSVSGGRENTASGEASSISGGYGNTASGLYSSVSGGYGNTASAEDSSVSGGFLSEASGVYSSVSGGASNTASGGKASVSGGQWNIASENNSSIAGGANNIASGANAFVAGGAGNEANATTSTIVGGIDNLTSGAEQQAIFGGEANLASGIRSTVTGGFGNQATAGHAVVSGGQGNIADTEGCWIGDEGYTTCP